MIGFDMTARQYTNTTSILELESRSVVMRCYFNLVNGINRIVDCDGIEVRDLEQVQVQAVKAIEELREEDGSNSSDWGNWSLEVTDSSGTVLFAINLNGVFH